VGFVRLGVLCRHPLAGRQRRAVYLQYAEHVRWEWLRAAGISHDALVEAGIGPVVLETTIRYQAELRVGDEVDVTCELRGATARRSSSSRTSSAPTVRAPPS
jgi:hypothetical protein